MKKGFLKNKILSNPPPPSKLVVPVVSPAEDNTRVLSNNPRIVQADVRLGNTSSCFLYLPHGAAEGEASMVVSELIDTVRKFATRASALLQEPVLVSTKEPCFQIVEIPGKGMGMVATRAIQPGELIVSERPTYVLPRMQTVVLGDPLQAAFPRQALDGLSETARNALLALKNAFPIVQGWDAFLGLLNTNTLPLALFDDAENTHVGVFTVLSRANHACAPSTYYHFASARFAGELRAARGLAAGDEITIGYCSLFDPRAARREYLAAHYFFDCACAVCALPPPLAAQSDARRAALDAFLSRPEFEGRTTRMPLEAFEEPLRWMDEEGLQSYRALVLGRAATIAIVHYDAVTGKLWAVRAREAFGILQGSTSMNYVKYKVVVDRLDQKLTLARAARKV